MAQADESVLDFPRDGLCPDIWEKVMSVDGASETWRMIPAKREKICNIAQMVCEEAKLDYSRMRVYITGSITSNTYTKNADIDVHLHMLYRIREAAEMTQRRVKDAFDRVKKHYDMEGLKGDESYYIAGHLIEVYYQPNEFQDYMSVGCYDAKADAWIVGPELKDPSYDPYSELYKDIQAKAGSLIKGIREKVLDVYEKAVVFSKVNARSKDTSTIQHASSQLLSSIASAVQLYEDARKMRKVYSSPTSVEQALQYRSSKKWKVADAAFKLMDKFGYLAILRKYKELLELLQTGDGDIAIEVVDAVMAAVKEYISNPEKLADSEQADEVVNESIAERKAKIWVDDIRPAPRGYLPIHSVNEFITWVDEHGTDAIEVLDLDHDAGDFQRDGGDYIRCLDYLEHLGAHSLKVRLHSANPVGIANMRRIIKKNSWTEVFDIYEGQYAESAKSFCSIAAIAAMLAIPGISSKDALGAQLSGLPMQNLTVNSPEVKAAIAKSTNGKSYHGMNAANVANAVARTVFAEAQGEGKDGQAAVASVIWNRAGGKPENLIPVISKKKQFSCWNSYSGGWTDKDYKFSIPQQVFKSSKAKQAWDNCIDLAAKLVDGSFKSTIGNRNSYMNKKTADKKNVTSWGKDLDLDVGSHSFGYFAWNDGFKGSKSQQTYVVKAGDTLEKIAKELGTTAAALARKNNIEDIDKIKVGQRLAT